MKRFYRTIMDKDGFWRVRRNSRGLKKDVMLSAKYYCKENARLLTAVMSTLVGQNSLNMEHQKLDILFKMNDIRRERGEKV